MLSISDFWVIHRQTIRIVLAVLMLFVMIGGTVWLFFFNKGKVIVVGQAPFVIEVPGIDRFDCLENECLLELAVGKYQLLGMKSGFEQVQIEAEVFRGEETRLEIEFVFVPKIDEVGAYEQQFQNASLFDVTIGHDEVAWFFERYKDESFAWLVQKKKFLFLDRDEQDSKQGIYLTGKDFADLKRITIFPRDIDKAALVPSFDENRVALMDTTNKAIQVYVIVLESGEKRKVGEFENLLGMKWVDNERLVLNRVKTGGEFVLELVELDTMKIRELPFMAELENLTSAGNGRILFVAGQISGVNSQNLPSEFWLSEYNIENEEVRSLVDVKRESAITPEKIEVDRDFTKVRILSNGRLYDVQLKD